MFSAANPVSIFVPLLVIVALTFVGFVRMAAGRATAMKTGIDPNFYKAHQGGMEPAVAVVGVRHYGNLFEMPTVFYAAVLTAFVLGAVGHWTLVFAWGYVAARLVQSAVHLTYNNPAHRGLCFVLGVVFMIALWVNLAIAIIARV